MQSLYALKITISNYCPYRCKYCYVNTTSKDVISQDRLFQSIDYYLSQTGKEKAIFFLWWEALLQFKILQEWILYARKKWTSKKLNLFLTTSWFSLTPEKIHFLFENQVQIGLSIDGDEYVHNLNRISALKKPTYKAVRESLDLINTKYSDTNAWYAMTVDENTVSQTFQSFLHLSHLDEIHRNITIAGVYKKYWWEKNIQTLEQQIKKICKFIYSQIPRGKFYYYNVLSFFLLEIQKWNILQKWNTEIHIFPDGQVSLYLFSQSILWNITDDPTSGRFDFVNHYAAEIFQASKADSRYQEYMDTLSFKAIL